MDDLKHKLIDWLCEEYTRESAIDQIEKASIKVDGNQITITYNNGAIDVLEVQYVEKLVKIK